MCASDGLVRKSQTSRSNWSKTLVAGGSFYSLSALSDDGLHQKPACLVSRSPGDGHLYDNLQMRIFHIGNWRTLCHHVRLRNALKIRLNKPHRLKRSGRIRRLKREPAKFMFSETQTSTHRFGKKILYTYPGCTLHCWCDGSRGERRHALSRLDELLKVYRA